MTHDKYVDIVCENRYVVLYYIDGVETLKKNIREKKGNQKQSMAEKTYFWPFYTNFCTERLDNMIR